MSKEWSPAYKKYTKSVVFYTLMMIKNKNKIINHWSIKMGKFLRGKTM